jgi:cytochrome P450
MLRNPKDAPQLPGRWPIFGHLPKITRDALALFRRAQAELGPVFWIDMGFDHRVLLVLDEQGFAVFKNKDTDSSHLTDFGAFLGGSMLTVDGSDHRRMRMASGGAFTPAGLSRAEVGQIIIETIERHISAWRGADRVAITEATKTIALEVIFRVMGIEVPDLPKWSRWYSEFLLGAINIPIDLPGMPAWRGRRARRWLEAEVRKIIATAREHDDHDSIVGAMVHGRDDHGAGMSEQELIDNLLILGFAGHETTASTMAWSMLHLSQSPRRWDRLVEEVAALDEVPADYAELAELAPFAGTSFLHLSRDLGRYEQPDEWRPERWLELDRKPTPIENCQFGGGPHFCLGYHMALLEGTLFLVMAGRTLSAWGRRPLPHAGLPQPRYIPLTQPPGKAKLRLV